MDSAEAGCDAETVPEMSFAVLGSGEAGEEMNDKPPYTCLRCEHVWTPKRLRVGKPRQCHGCKTPLWNTPRIIKHFGKSITVFLRMISVETDKCIEWPFGKTFGGYGRVYDKNSGGNRRAHVASWEITNGRKSPKGMNICHTCDNPPCINPKHLFLGTHLRNMQDAAAKGRIAKGERVRQAILSSAAVRFIRTSGRGMKLKELSRMFGAHISTICSVRNGVTWKHIEM